MKRRLLERLQDLRARGVPVAVLTRLADGAQALVTEDALEGDLAPLPAAVAAARARVRQDRSGRLEEVDPALFARVYNPPLRLVLVGAVHVAQALAPMARTAGYAVTIIDPRTAFATEARFPGIRLVTEWPDAAMRALAPDRRTAVVTLTHDPKLDDPALLAALDSEAFFIGALGSRRTHAARVARLREAGVEEAALARIRAPVGLALGGRLPAEIAVAILAEIIAVLRGGATVRD